MPDPSISLRELAGHLGLAPSTVSVALRPGGRIAPATRERVLEAAERLGYRPDPVLSALSRRKHGGIHAFQKLAILVHNDAQDSTLHSESVLMAEQLGYQTESFSLTEYEKPEALAHVLYHRGIAGVMVPENPRLPDLSQFPWELFSAVQCGVVYQSLPIDLVRFNPFDCARLAWEKLVDRGYRRIGAYMLHHPDGRSPIDEKMVAALAYCQERDNQRVESIPIHYGSTAEISRSYPEWYQKWQPDAVIGPWDSLYALQVKDYSDAQNHVPAYVALRANGKRPVAGFLTARPAVEAVALRHLDQLIRHNIKGTSTSKVTLVMEPTWHPGSSLPE